MSKVKVQVQVQIQARRAGADCCVGVVQEAASDLQLAQQEDRLLRQAH